MAIALTEKKSDNFKQYLADVLDATGLNATDGVSTSDLNVGTIQVVHAGHTAGTSTWKLQASIDGTNWDDITAATKTTSGVSGSETLIIDPLPGGKVRLLITASNGSVAPTLSMYFQGRKGGN